MSKLKENLSKKNENDGSDDDEGDNSDAEHDADGKLIQLDDDLLNSRNLVTDRQFILNQMHINR